MDPRLTSTLSRCLNAIERDEIADRFAPSADERRALELRREALGAGVGGGDIESIKRSIARLFGLMPVVGLDADNAEVTVTEYARVLSLQPLWAVNAACRAVLDSGAKFRPGAPELLALAREKGRAIHAEANKITRVLSAKVYHTPTAAERERIRVGFADLGARLGSSAKDRAEPVTI
jgi:hypothetical protein